MFDAHNVVAAPFSGIEIAIGPGHTDHAVRGRIAAAAADISLGNGVMARLRILRSRLVAPHSFDLPGGYPVKRG
jgi:hypothetical protein